jgi:hypothetical protein
VALKIFSLAALVSAIGCMTTVMYPGPRRSADEVAVLTNDDTAIDVLDGQAFRHVHSQNAARYEVLPGRHVLGISIFAVTVNPGGYGDIERSPNTIFVCLDAQAGHTYVIGYEGREAHWRPVVTDEKTRATVPFVACTVSG